MHNEKLTLMAIREELMVYFKGDCIERLVESDSVRILENGYSDSTRPYFFERRERELQNSSTLRLKGVAIAQLGHNPERLVFETDTMKRSPQLRKLRTEMEQFMGLYLGGVKIGESNANE